jgi:hypothetical protein
MIRRLLIGVGFGASLGTLCGIFSACTSTTRPCTDAGDVSWPNSIKGDKRCYQRRDAEGKYVNHGKYYQYHLNGKIAVEGQFEDGRKEGIWIEYNEKGDPVVKKYYEKGVELAIPTKAP